MDQELQKYFKQTSDRPRCEISKTVRYEHLKTLKIHCYIWCELMDFNWTKAPQEKYTSSGPQKNEVS